MWFSNNLDFEAIEIATGSTDSEQRRIPSRLGKGNDMNCSFNRIGVGFVLVLYFVLPPLAAQAVTYTMADTIDLSPSALLGMNSDSQAGGISGSQQVGEGLGDNTGGTNHALLWTGTAAGAVDLNPAAVLGTSSYSAASGTSGSQQVGDGNGPNTGFNNHALLWTGTAASAVDLNPAALLGASATSTAVSISGGQQVGYGAGANTGNRDHALLWTGTSASAVDLNPVGVIQSYASATSGGQQVGYGSGSQGFHALLWTGTAASVVDLNPGALLGTGSRSYAYGTSGTQQVGFGSGANTRYEDHALLWSSTAASAVDLNPVSLLGTDSFSYANGTSGSQQVGYGEGGNTGGNNHALLWTGTAASAIDLHALLPAGFYWSQAQAVDPYGNIVGYAITSIDGAEHAVAWLAGDMYVGSGGDWTGNTWTAGTPALGNDVLLIKSDGTNRVVTYSDSAPAVMLGQITIDATGAGSMTLSQTSGTLSSTNEIIGFLGTGTFNQTGGTHNVTGTITIAAKPGSQGTYNLSGSGALNADAIVVIAGGSFNQSGGTLKAVTFTQAGGTVTGTLQNQGTFIYQSGRFSGRLLNQGTVVLNADFTATGGMENDALFTLASGRTVRLSGAGLDGSGTTRLNAGSDLTATHIIQSALVIGGTSKSPGLVTIDASDALGNPFNQTSGLALASSLAPRDPTGTGGIGSADLSSSSVSDLAFQSPISSVGSSNPSSVPEPSTLLLVSLAITSLIGQRLAIRHRARRTDF